MGNLLEKGGVAAAGLVTSLLTAAIVTVFDMWTGVNLFTFSIWIVVPAGAAFCGFAAASGYYFGAKYFHQRPTRTLLIQMIAIAAATQWLIYWLEYETLVVEGTRVADMVPFGLYLDIMFTKTHISVGRTAGIDAGEVGSFGYWLAVLDFIGFVAGGVFVYIVLKNQLTCEACSKYLRAVVKKKDSFADFQDFAGYYDGVYANPVDSPEFAQHVGREYSAGRAQQGTVNLTTTVFECPKCFDQSVQEAVKVCNGRDWKDVDELKRLVAIPRGIDVRPAFGA